MTQVGKNIGILFAVISALSLSLTTDVLTAQAQPRGPGYTVAAHKEKIPIATPPFYWNGHICYVNGGLYEIDPNSGKETACIPLVDSQLNPSLTFRPIMIDDSLYAAGGDFLTSIDPSTGKNRWKFKVDGLCHQPLLFHGVLYVSTSSGFVYTLDPASGRQISSSKLKNGGYSVDGLQKIDDGTIGAILFGYPKPCCYIGLDAGTGKEKWEVQPVVQESDWPVFASSNLACFANHESLDVRELPSGNKKWHVDVGGLLGLFAPPTVIGGTVYYSEGNTFHAVDLSSGQSKWTYGIGGGCNVAVSNGVVIVAAAKHVYALDEATGHLKWKGNINTPGKYAPCIADGLIFVGGDDGYIYALDFSTGAPSWSYTSHEYTVPAQHWAD